MTDYEDRNTTADDTVSAYGAAAITKSDTTVIPTTRAVWVGGAGDLAVVMNRGETITFTGVPAGTLMPIQVTKVLAATTATSMTAMY
jgi:hypothetical protein